MANAAASQTPSTLAAIVTFIAMQKDLIGAFVYGVGLEQAEYVLAISNNALKVTYKIWFASFKCEMKSRFSNKGMEEDEIGLLTLSQLMYLTIAKVELNENEDLLITFENNVQIKILGSISDPNCVEPYRVYQQTPDSKEILTAYNK